MKKATSFLREMPIVPQELTRSDQYVRVIFERGLQLLHSEGGWLIPSSKSHHSLDSPEDFETRFATRRLITYRDVAPFLYPRTVWDKEGRKLSTPRYLKGYVEDERRRIYKYQVEHFLFTAVTHLAYLAEAYAGLAVLKNHDEWQIGEDTVVTSSRHLYSSALLHSESVFTALASAMRASRHLVWRWRGAPPNTLGETVESVIALGEPELDSLLVPLDDCQAIWTSRIEAYRDCGGSYHSEEDLGGRSGGDLLFDDVWEIAIDLPDNPGAPPHSYTFADDIDALDLCWEATTAVVRAIESSLPAVFYWAQMELTPQRRWI